MLHDRRPRFDRMWSVGDIIVDTSAPSAPIEPTDVIYMPHRRRLFHEWGVLEGQRTLTLHYGEKEVVFDEPDQIPFGEALLAHARFVAQESTCWTATRPRAWESARELLEILVAEGILAVEAPLHCPFAHASEQHGAAPALADDAEQPEAPTLADDDDVQQQHPTSARTWTATETPALSREIFGVTAEVGQLESLLRGWQIPHPAQDVDGRQLGDENVFPSQLYVETPTQRRPCRYAGSRYQHTTQMNVTGLRLVQQGWSEAIAVLRSLKAAFLRRRSRSAGGLTIAELLTFATCVLTLPGYMLHRRARPVRSGEFPVSIAALFRIIDGTRLASRVMLLTDDPEFRVDTVPTPESFHFYCEKNLLFFNGTRGVCAGPPAAIREFLTEVMRTDVVDDTPAIPAALVDAVGDLEAAIDYGCAAIELELELDRFWIRQLELARELHHTLAQAPAEPGTPVAELGARLGAMLSRPGIIPFLDVPLEVSRSRVCESLVEVARTCRRLRAQPSAIDTATGAIDEPPHAFDGPEAPMTVRAASSRTALRLAKLEQGAFEAAARVQAEINALLDRPAPTAAFGPREAARQWPAASLRAAIDEFHDATASIIVDSTECAATRGCVVEPPRARDDRDFPVLRRMFARARFGLATAVRHAWGCSLDSDLEAAKTLSTLLRASGGWPEHGHQRAAATPLDVLIRLFLGGGALAPAVVHATLRTEECEALYETGLAVLRDGTVVSPFSVAPVDGLYLVTDNPATIDAGRDSSGGPNALVMPGYLETYAFAQRLHRHPVARSLDICTGSGVHALLGSRYADTSVGTDISPRAIAFAEWNRRLNGIDRVQFHVSDTFSALPGARFDRITANPPYQPDSQHAAGENWWGAGPRGTAVIDRIVAGLPEHLEPDGELQMIGRFLSWREVGFVDHVRHVLGPAAADFSIALDVEHEPLSQIAAMYPSERLTGLVRSEYGVVTITRLR